MEVRRLYSALYLGMSHVIVSKMRLVIQIRIYRIIYTKCVDLQCETPTGNSNNGICIKQRSINIIAKLYLAPEWNWRCVVWIGKAHAIVEAEPKIRFTIEIHYAPHSVIPCDHRNILVYTLLYSLFCSAPLRWHTIVNIKQML